MRSPLWLASAFTRVAFSFAIAAGCADAQIALPATGNINTVAGTGTAGYSGDNGLAVNAALYNPRGVAVDSSGNVYIADTQNNLIRKVTASTGVITTFAGNGTAGYSGDGASAAGAALNGPTGLALDASGNIYIADTQNNRIREVTVSTGIISTVAGNGSAGFSGDGASGTAAALNGPTGVALDGSGNIYIADTQNNRIREVTVSTGVITTIAGNGTAGYNGDAQSATSAELNGPQGIVFDKYGNIYIADVLNHRVREVGLGGMITTVAGTGVAGYSGDAGQANLAQVSGPLGLATDANGNLFVADTGNMRVREVTTSTGVITTVAGNSTAAFAGDNGVATSAELNGPSGLVFDAGGNLYIGDAGNNRIRVIGGSQATIVSPRISNQYCEPQGLSITARLASAGGIFNYPQYNYYTYTSFTSPGCTYGTAPLTSNQGWVNSFNQTGCSPSTEIFGIQETCTYAFNAATNTGPSRQATVTATYTGSLTQSVTVLQDGPTQTLTVGISGSGTVTSNVSGISCPGACVAGFPLGTSVSLTASPSYGYAFSGWSGACSGTGACVVPMLSATSVTATFTALPPTFTLSLTNPSQTTPLSLGHSMTYTVRVNPMYGFTGTVTLSVIGLPTGVTAQFSSTSLTSSGIATLTLSSAYSNTTHIGSSTITVFGNTTAPPGSSSPAASASIILQTQPLQYKGYCGVI